MRIQKNARIRFVWDVDTKNEDQSIEQAVQAARESEIAIVVVGIEEGEFRDRGYLALPGRQEELIRRVAATGKTTVVVLIGGSAVVMSEWQDQVPAVLNAWYPGVEGAMRLPMFYSAIITPQANCRSLTRSTKPSYHSITVINRPGGATITST